ncbi:MAG: fibronectin type III domain-containing protein [Candidatus Aenigmatarchaeota archaeon]
MKSKQASISTLLFFLLISSSAKAFCIDRTPPSAPSDLVIHDSPYDLDGNITLTWSPATDGPCNNSAVAYYKIYRSEDGENFTLIGTSNSTSFEDFSSLPEGTYWYRVTAVDNVVDNPHEGPWVEGSTIVTYSPPTTTTTQPQQTTTTTSAGGGGGGMGGFILPQPTTTTQPAPTTTQPIQPTEQPTTTTQPVQAPEETTTTLPPGNLITGFVALVAENAAYQLLIALAVIALLLFIFRRRMRKRKR